MENNTASLHSPRYRTRLKICGFTREQDIRDAVALGVDALGLVFYPASPRYVSPERAAQLLLAVPAFVSPVGLFVNASIDEVLAVTQLVPLQLLQFHGDETAAHCHTIAAAVETAFIRAYRVKPDTKAADLLECDALYRATSPWYKGLLLDTFVDSFGGSGKVFDWSLIPKELAPRVVLSGGLSVQNVTEAVASVRPFAVDISSGVEQAKGVKDAVKMAAFVRALNLADSRVC